MKSQHRLCLLSILLQSSVLVFAYYSYPKTTVHTCTELTVKDYVPDVVVKKFQITTLQIHDQLFYKDGYTLSFKPNDASLTCWYHYAFSRNRMIFIPNKAVLAIDHPFTVTGENYCSSAESWFNVHVTTAPDNIYCLKIETLVQSNSLDTSCEANHVFLFVDKLAKYFNTNYDDFRVFDYENVKGKTDLLKISWTFPDQMLNCYACNPSFLFKQFIQKLVYQHGEINENFFNYMNVTEPSFSVHHVQYESNCNDVITAKPTPTSMPPTPPSTPMTPPSTPMTPPSTPMTPPSTPMTTPSTPMTPPSSPVTPPSTSITPPSTPMMPPSTPATPPSTNMTPTSTPVTPPSTPMTPPSTPVTPPSTPMTPPSTPVTTSDSTPSNCIQPMVIKRIEPISVPALKPTTFLIPFNTFNQEVKINISLLHGQTSCWFRVSGNMIHFLPLQDVFLQQPIDGYKFNMVAYNTCGDYATLPFSVRVLPLRWSDCLTFTLVVARDSWSCDVDKRIILLERLQHYTQNKFDYLFLESLFVVNETYLKFSLSTNTFDCERCNEQKTRSFKQNFIQENGALLPLFEQLVKSLLELQSVKFLFADSCERCYYGNLQTVQLTPGVYKQLELDVKLKTLNLMETSNLCWAYTTTADSIKFLPPLSFTSLKRKIEFQLEGCALPQLVTIDFNAISIDSFCFTFKLTFFPKDDFTCLVQPVRQMMITLASHFNIKTEDIAVVSYNVSSRVQNKKLGVDAIFAFSEQLLPRSVCSNTAVNFFMLQLTDFNGMVDNGFSNNAASKFEIHSVSYQFIHRSTIDEDRFSNYTTSYVPLWLYLLPIFIVLFVVILLLLICCCSPTLYRCFVSCCCAMCFRGHPVKHQRMTSETYDVNNHGTSKSTSYSSDGRINRSLAYKQEQDLERNSVCLKTETNNEILSGTKIHSVVNDGAVESRKSSIRVRSYSDSDLLDESSLKLPVLPYGIQQSTEIRRNTQQNHTTKTASVLPVPGNGHSKFCLKYPIRVPIKMSARVTNVSRNPVINLDTFKPKCIVVERTDKKASLPSIRFRKMSSNKSISMDRISNAGETRKYDLQFTSFYPRKNSAYRKNSVSRRYSRKGFTKFTSYASDSEV